MKAEERHGMYLHIRTAPQCRNDITSALNDSSSLPLTADITDSLL